jgi:hypothetical protein
MRLPAAEYVKFTDTVQDPGVELDCAGTVPPLSENVVDPATAVTDPPQVLMILTGLAITSPGCSRIKLSVQAALVNGNALGLKTDTRRRAVPPAGIERGVKALFISAGRVVVCASATDTGAAKMEMISVPIKKDITDFFMSPLSQMS